MLDILVEDPLSGVLLRRLVQALQAFGLRSVLKEQFFAYAGCDACSSGCLAHPFVHEHGVGREFVISGYLLLICWQMAQKYLAVVAILSIFFHLVLLIRLEADLHSSLC